MATTTLKWAGACTSLLMLAGAAGAGTAGGLPDQAVAYQINSAHTGSVTTPNLAPPLVRRWTVDLGADVSYPLIAQGKIYVTVGDNSSGLGVVIEALSQATGAVVWGPFQIRGTYWWANACYDAGAVYVVNDNGLLFALNADTGATLWQEQLAGQYGFNSPPTAANGIVYTGGSGTGGTLYAVRESDGAALWTASVENGDSSSPAVSADGVYVSYAGPQSYKFDPAGGSLLWHYNSGSEGGGGATPVLSGGSLYVRDSNLVLDSATGVQSMFTGGPNGVYNAVDAPAFDGGSIFQINGSNLEAGSVTNSASGYTVYYISDTPQTAPIAANGLLYLGFQSGAVKAINESTGATVWSDTLPSGILSPNERDYTRPTTGLAAGQSLLVVPAGHLLAAYGAAPPPAPVNLTATATGTVSLRWTAPAGVTGATYSVYRGTAPGGETFYKSAGSATSFSNGFVTPGTLYYYTVKTVVGSQTSAASSEVSARPVALPGAPTNLTATASGGKVTLRWGAPYAGPVSSYSLYRGTASDAETFYKSTTSTTFVNGTVVIGTHYYYTVKAVNAAGAGAASNEANATP